MRIALFGVGYFPNLTSGEKNFYLKLSPFLKERFEDIIVISVNDQLTPRFIQETDHGPIYIYNLKRPLHFGDLTRFYSKTADLFHYHQTVQHIQI